MIKRGRFEIYPSKGQWFWRLVAGNGEIIAPSEGYTRKEDAYRATLAVRLVAPLARTVEGTN